MSTKYPMKVKISDNKYIVLIKRRLGVEALKPKVNFWGKVVGIESTYSYPLSVYENCIVNFVQSEELYYQAILLKTVEDCLDG